MPHRNRSSKYFLWITCSFFDHNDQFRDLTNYAEKTAHLHGAAAALGSGLPAYNYPAPAAFVYKILLHPFPSQAVRG
ncbi:MAG: hypothetical protein P4K80_00020 [Acidobacteriaceae bacterium]|nr:hypothetical protein [Acidobacteriaceae bacterium]